MADLTTITGGGSFTRQNITGINNNFSALNSVVSMLQATTTLTNAQIIALQTTPIALVAAPGANKLAVPVYCNIVQHFPVTPYSTVDAAASLSVSVGDVIASSSVDISGSFGSTTPYLAMVPITSAYDVEGFLYIGPNDQANLLNKAIYLSCYNNSVNFTGGAAANTLGVSLVYMVLNVTTGLFE